MIDPTHIFNWRRYDRRLTTSGQPTEAQLDDLKALGVAHVINLGLHTHEKALPDEAASVAARDMRYTHIPVAFDNPTEADFQAFCSTMTAADETTIHVHCIMNYRVTAFLYRYQRDVLGVDEANARAAMEQVWQPDTSDHPTMLPWAKFIARR